MKKVIPVRGSQSPDGDFFDPESQSRQLPKICRFWPVSATFDR